MNRFLSSKWTKRAVFLIALTPLLLLFWWAWQASQGDLIVLTANPIEFIEHYTGDWCLRFLMITLAITPLRTLVNRPAITGFRRMLGLYAFFYGTLHMLIWLGLDRAFEWGTMVDDVLKRLYITVGMAGYLMMLPLAVTSTQGWVRRLGYQRWRRLHRLVYVSALAGVLHFYWLVKSDVREPLLYGAIWAGLMAFRVKGWIAMARSGNRRLSQQRAGAR